ncbi:DUF6273 domain-containing protein [Clostridium disporicum]|uniref:DUF6273 domain-containing protein n=1 Tax=Clostridium disporicum TaxID=84024 RepID=UPI0034A556B9
MFKKKSNAKRNVALFIFISLALLNFDKSVSASDLSVSDQNRLLGATAREWESSNLREWLNSDKETVDYTANPPTYKNEAGFLSDTNFTQEERDAIAVTRHSGGFLETLSGNINDTLYISQRGLAKNTYIYNDKVFILNYTELVNYVERNKQLMNMNQKYYSNYLQNATNKKDKYSYIVNTGGVNSSYTNWNNMYSSTIGVVYGRSQNNIVPALSLKPDYVLSNGIKSSNLTVGQTVTFGKYNGEPIEWQVINISDAGYPLLWSTKIITSKEYDAQGDINPLKSNYINFDTYNVDITTGTGQNKSWETQTAIQSYPVISIINESVLTTPTNDNEIIIQIKVTDDNNSIRKITLPDGTVVNGATASYTITKNGEYDIIAENSQGVITVRHIVTKAINTPAEVTITTDKSSDSKWTNKPVNIIVSATNNGVYTKTTSSKSTGYNAINASTFPSWMPLSGKRIRVTGTLYNKITDEDIAKYNLNMNANIIFRFIYQKYTVNSLSNTYPQFKTITLKSLKEAGSISIDEVFTIPNDVYGKFYIQINLMNETSNYMKTGYNWGASEFTYEILDKDDLKIEEITLPGGNIIKNDTATYTINQTGSYTFSAKDNRGKITSKTIDIAIDMVNPEADIVYDQNPTTENVVLNINTTDALSGIKSIKLPNGESRTNTTDGKPLSTTYNILENGSYTFVVTDFAGNQISKTVTIKNIDKIEPKLTYTTSPTEWTNSNVTINVTASDEDSGINHIVLPNGNVVSSVTASYTVSANGVYWFQTFDNYGHQTTIKVTVENIDKEIPTFTISNNENWTNQDVQISISATD